MFEYFETINGVLDPDPLKPHTHKHTPPTPPAALTPPERRPRQVRVHFPLGPRKTKVVRSGNGATQLRDPCDPPRFTPELRSMTDEQARKNRKESNRVVQEPLAAAAAALLIKSPLARFVPPASFMNTALRPPCSITRVNMDAAEPDMRVKS